MDRAVITPLTQALREGALDRAELRALMARSDGPALRRLALWVAVLAATGSGVWLALGTWWLLVPAMVLHGVVLVHHFSLQHECTHYTAFRTRRLNDLVGGLCGLIIMLPPRFFRYEHCDHHTHTQIPGDDPELIPLPTSFARYLLYLSGLPYWRAKLAELARHSAGRLSAEDRRFVPEVEAGKIVAEARAMVLFYAGLTAVMVVTGWWAPLWFWFLPVLLGEPVMRFIRVSEHVGRPMTPVMRENTRTTLVSLPWRFLCWNMNHHAEHHYVPSVPFHALPRLHERLRGRIHVEPGGYWGANADIVAQIRRRRPPGHGAAAP